MDYSVRRYEQPYRSRHIINGTIDPLREDLPAYIKNFVRFLHNIYMKQTPFKVERNLDRQQSGFKTISNRTPKSPVATISAVPSDFEHIYHNSDF